MIGRVCVVDPGQAGLARAANSLLRAADDGLVLDSRGALGTRSRRDLVLDELTRHVLEVEPQILGGVANSGTTWAVLLSDRLGIDFVNVLVDGPRAKGLGRRLEPDGVVAGSTVLLVDNWIETGSSIAVAASIVSDAGAEVLGAVSVSAAPGVDLGFPVHLAFPFDDLLMASSSPL